MSIGTGTAPWSTYDPAGGMDEKADLRARRVQLGITQEEVRARTGLSVTTIAKIESGDPTVSRSSLRRYEEALRSGDEIVSLVEELAPLVAEQLRAGAVPVERSIGVDGIPEDIVLALEQLVLAIRRYRS